MATPTPVGSLEKQISNTDKFQITTRKVTQKVSNDSGRGGCHGQADHVKI